MMTEYRIKESLAAAVEENTPDILEDLMNELGIKDEPKEMLGDAIAKEAGDENSWIPGMVPKKSGNAGLMKKLAGCAAALIIAVTGITFASGRDTLAVVSLDVNPGIEISIDKNERVLRADPVNEEAAEILSEMDLKGTDIDVACSAIVGSMLTHGYLSDLQNSILLSVSADDEQRGTEIEKRLSGEVNNYLENTEIAAAVLGQVVSSDETLRAYADSHGISLGKAWLIQNLLGTGSTKMTEADLLSLSTQDLILLGQKRGVAVGTSYGEAESGGYIGHEKALDIALEKAGADRSSATEMKYEFDCEKGVLIYEVSFRVGDYEYDYDINAYDGSVVSSEKEYDPVTPAQSSSSSASSSSSSASSSSQPRYDYDDDDDYDDRYDRDDDYDDRYDSDDDDDHDDDDGDDDDDDD